MTAVPSLDLALLVVTGAEKPERPPNSFLNNQHWIEMAMPTERQLQLEQAFRDALKELGTSVSAEFLIAAASERTQAEPREIIEAVEVVNRGRESEDEGTSASDHVTALLLALGKAVAAIWGKLPQNVQHELFERSVSAQDEATRLMPSRLAPSPNPTAREDDAPPSDRSSNDCLRSFCVRSAVSFAKRRPRHSVLSRSRVALHDPAQRARGRHGA